MRSSSALLFLTVCVHVSSSQWHIGGDRGQTGWPVVLKGKMRHCPAVVSSGWEACSNQDSPLFPFRLQSSERQPAVSEGTCLHPSSGTPQWALEAKWGVSLLKGGLSADFKPIEGVCLVSQVQLIQNASTLPSHRWKVKNNELTDQIKGKNRSFWSLVETYSLVFKWVWV